MSNLVYTNEDRDKDFEFYKENFDDLYKKYGHCFLGIRNKEVIGTSSTPVGLLESLKDQYPAGTYILQESSNDRSVYIARITRLMVNAAS